MMKAISARVTRFVGVTISLLALVQSSLAQCAMCRASLANSDNPAEASIAVNAGILFLLIPTVAMLAGLVALVVRYHRSDSPQ
jgi:uncharacterized paraquat-inducible protein A